MYVGIVKNVASCIAAQRRVAWCGVCVNAAYSYTWGKPAGERDFFSSDIGSYIGRYNNNRVY